MAIADADLAPGATQARAELVHSALAGNLDLWLSVVVAGLVTVNNLFWPEWTSAGRVVLALLLVLVLPGYMLVGSLFPDEGELDGWERWGLSVTLSIVLDIAVALVLSVAAVPLSTSSVTVSLAALVGCGAVITTTRRQTGSAHLRHDPRLSGGALPWIVLGVGLVIGMTTWRMVGASLGAVQPEFSLTNKHGALGGYPFAIAVGSRYRLQMRLANPTDRAVRYWLQVSDKRGAQLESQVVTASPHQQWMRSIVLPASPPAGRERVDFRLYQHKMVVRHVWVRYRIVP